jgi:hypothetical protein
MLVFVFPSAHCSSYTALSFKSGPAMAGSRFAYVKNFELPDPLLPGTFIMLRLDGHSFHRHVPQLEL